MGFEQIEVELGKEEKEKPLSDGNHESGKENVLQWYFTTIERKSQVKESRKVDADKR